MVDVMRAEPRAQHYLFVHRTLRDLVLTNWTLMRPAFADGSAARRLQRMWDRVGESLPVDARVEGDVSLETTAVDVGGAPAFVITLPLPEAIAEGGLVLVLDHPDQPRYLILELGFRPETKQSQWMLCEWAAEAHLELGPVGDEPAAEPSAMVAPMIARAQLAQPNP
jgi:hypothetical protein